jgi:hypothetical protein
MGLKCGKEYQVVSKEATTGLITYMAQMMPYEYDAR